LRDVFDASGHLTVADAQFHLSSDGREYLTLHIKRYKTDQALWPSGLRGVRTKALAIRDYSVNPATPIFQVSDGSPVTKTRLITFVTFVSHLLRLIGIDPSQNNGHSFRICCATSASIARLSYNGIKLIGRGNSDCYRPISHYDRTV